MAADQSIGSTDAAEAEGSTAKMERDIEQTREELGKTVEQIAARLDVKSAAQQRVVAARDAAKARPGTVAAVGGVAVVAGVAGVVAARRRRR